MLKMDPVCGMWLPPSEAAAAVVREGLSYYFCTEKCADAFTRDPERFVSHEDFLDCDGERTASRADAPVAVPASSQAPERRTCPYCAGHAIAVPTGGEMVGELGVDEFATIALSEWRRRLGSARYEEVPSATLIRSLITRALLGEVSEAEDKVEANLLAGVRRMRERGRRYDEVRESLLVLSVTLWDVLSSAGLPLPRATELMEKMDRILLHPLLF